MTISFLYNGIVAVYYALMGLGTTETTESLALVLIPPGNVLRSIAEYRKTLWAGLRMASARAWFDYPVLSWLHHELDYEVLSRLAAEFILPFALLEPERHGASIYLPFPREILDFSDTLQTINYHGKIDGGFSSGPFEAGVGCFCASLDMEEDTINLELLPRLSVPIRARTCIIAQVAIEWTSGPDFYSSWRFISGSRVHGLR